MMKRSFSAIALARIMSLVTPTYWREISRWILLLTVGLSPIQAAGQSGLEKTNVFESGTGGYHTYRIPSVVSTRSGSLLAFCEGRKQGRADSGDIDMLLRRSDDGGKTWGRQQVIWNDDANVCGNPCPVVDHVTGTIWLLMTHNLGTDHEGAIIRQESKGTRTVWVCQSEDDGASWSKPVDITASTKLSEWTWYATGPGAGIQLRHGRHKGRLVIPCDHIEAETNSYYSHIIFSDDHGTTWKLGGTSPRDKVNECEVIELADGRLMLNMRNYDRSQHARQIAFSDDGGLTWGDQRHDKTLIEPLCQASIRRASWPADGKPGLLLFSNPASRDARRNMTVRASLDEAAHWPVARQIYAGSSAYSSLAVLPDGSMACLFEADGYRRIVLARFTRDWLFDSN